MTMTAVDPRTAVFGLLYEQCTGMLELRAVHPMLKSTPTDFVSPEDVDAITRFACLHPTDHIFFGVATRRDATGGKLENCLELSGLFVDLDFKLTPEVEARPRLAEFPFPPTIVIHSGGGVHCYWVFREALDLQNPTERALAKTLLRRLALYLKADMNSAEPAKVLRVPGTLNVKPEYGSPRQVVVELVDPERRYHASAFDDLLPAESPRTERSHAESRFSDGQRNTDLTREAGRLRRIGLTQTELTAALLAINQTRCRPPVDEAEVHRIAQSIARYPPAVTAINCTDTGNAIRFATQHRDAVRWCPAWKSWLNYDGTRWVRDPHILMMELAKQTARSILDEAQQAAEDDRRTSLTRWSLTSETATRLQSMLELAKSEEGIPILDPRALDRDPWLLNVRNGTLELRTGVLRPHDRADLITKLVPITYDPAAQCPTWRAFLNRIMGHDAGLIDFLQTAFGYSLTGSVREQVLFLLHGKGQNGKTTLVRILLALLGEYGLQTAAETLLIAHDGQVRNDLARFAGMRLVAAMESDAGRRLAAALIKQLTGGDLLTARFLYGEYFDIEPTWKMWFSTNHRPVINDEGDAMWRRLRCLPFTVQIPDGEQDKDLPEKLLQELPGILAWAIHGCLRWQRDGLQSPAVVTDATASYRDAESTFEHFLDECCEQDPRYLVRFSELQKAYTDWVGTDRPMSSKALGTALAERGFHPIKRGGIRHYQGLQVRIGI